MTSQSDRGSPQRRPGLSVHLVRGVALAGGMVERFVDRTFGPRQTQQMIGFLQRIFRRTTRPRAPGRSIGRSGHEVDLERLLAGKSKQEVHRKLGPPRNATVEGAILPASPDEPLFWQAATWYYPFDSAERTAMAVHFAGNVVSRIELIRTAADQPAPHVH